MKKILYIEDEANHIAAVEEVLGPRGCEIIPAKDGEEGLKKISESKPDLILLDLFLPSIGGFEVCERLKKDPETKDIPILVITASGAKYLEEQCRSAGVNGCIRKPYAVGDLIAKVNALLEKI